MNCILKVELIFHYKKTFLFSFSCRDNRNTVWTEFQLCNVLRVQQKFQAFFK